MQSEFDEEIREFLIESNENLAMLDQQIVELEQDPENPALISSIFRTIHSIKGTCGFFGFDILGSVTHLAESILMQVRERQRKLTPALISLILEAIDAVKVLLSRIEATGAEGTDETGELRERLDAVYRAGSSEDPLHTMMRAATAKSEPAAPAAPPAAAAPTPVEAPVAAPPVASVPAAVVAAPAPAAAAPVVAPAPAPVAAAPVVAAPPAAAALPAAAIAKEPAGSKAAEAAGAPEKAEASGDLHLADSTIRVDVNLLNQLMNLVGELVLTRNQLLQAAGGFTPAVQQTSQRLNIITTELQEGVMNTRLQPIGVIWNKLPRVVRDIAEKCGKQIQIDMQGAETELDKSLIEAIRDPLTHLVRNSCDHGIESPADRQKAGKPPTGILSLRAFHEAGAVNIEISDDGAGINPDKVKNKALEKKLITPEVAMSMSKNEAINLIFLPGFSTAEQVTSLSGRGVGMDVVKTNIEKISGSVEVVAAPQGGTIVRIKIPLTLAIIPGLIVSSRPRTGQKPGREDRFVIPQSHLVELTRVDMTASPCVIEKVHGASIFRHRGTLLPLVFLSRLLKREVEEGDPDQVNIIILQVAGRQFGLVVDRICDTQEIVVKPLGQQLKHLGCYGGATIMGDGQPALILDVGGIARLAGLEARNQPTFLAQTAEQGSEVTQELLLFRAGPHQRLALPLSIVNRLEEIPANALESAAGRLVVSYRGELLTLLHVESFLAGSDSPSSFPVNARLKVVVINNGDRRVGLVVDEILDIVDGSISIMRSSSSRAIMGSAVIAGAVTDLLDLTAMQENSSPAWSRSTQQKSYAQRVLVYDTWALSREMTLTLLGSAGYLHCHAGNAAAMRGVLGEGPIDALVMAVDSQGVPAWWPELRRSDARLAGVPQILLCTGGADGQPADKNAMESDAILDRHDRAGLLQALSDLIAAQLEKQAA